MGSTTIATGPSRSMINCFSASLSEVEAATSKLASIRDAVTFACWPPGPDERDARHRRAESLGHAALLLNPLIAISSSIRPSRRAASRSAIL